MHVAQGVLGDVQGFVCQGCRVDPGFKIVRAIEGDSIDPIEYGVVSVSTTASLSYTEATCNVGGPFGARSVVCTRLGHFCMSSSCSMDTLD